ncbi:MAG: hypothetical protein GY807_17010 [Gammaproteobacteria bacterium]|nr:hypothetical protein [Gammaproteobacteria bacterium]
MSLNNIPNHWSAEQALAIYEFLAQIQQQIWDRYESELIDLLCADLETLNAEQPDLFEFNDAIPF